jgi:hypothetical protein
MKIFVMKKPNGDFMLSVRAEGSGIIGDAFGELKKGDGRTFMGLSHKEISEEFNNPDFNGVIELRGS